jgi:RIO-like serine/threonine protein kinase
MGLDIWIIQELRLMNDIEGIDKKILEAINDRSPMKWVNSVNVKRALRLEKIVFRDHLARLKTLGHVDTQPANYPEGHSNKNGINQIRLTDLGRSVLRGRR